MRLLSRLSSWLNDTLLRLTALYSLTGMLTSPKLIAPLQIGLGIATLFPVLSPRETHVTQVVGSRHAYFPPHHAPDRSGEPRQGRRADRRTADHPRSERECQQHLHHPRATP